MSLLAPNSKLLLPSHAANRAACWSWRHRGVADHKGEQTIALLWIHVAGQCSVSELLAGREGARIVGLHLVHSTLLVFSNLHVRFLSKILLGHIPGA